jgi:hypothetical protein
MQGSSLLLAKLRSPALTTDQNGIGMAGWVKPETPSRTLLNLHRC